jgi:CBS domain-containing protein
MNKGLVRDWMTQPVITVTPKTLLSEAHSLMTAEKIRSLPVVNDGQLVGIVTRRGLLRSDISSLNTENWSRGVDLTALTIDQVMTPNVLTITPQSPLPKAARVMMENKIMALPVTNQPRELVGIITSSDLFRAVIEEAPALKDVILVKNYMTTELVTITEDTPLLEIHRLMGVKRIRSFPVMRDDTLVGIVTRTDIMNADPSKFLARNNQDLSRSIESETAGRIMSKNLVTIQAERPVIEAARLMLEHKIHCVPVFQASQMVGIITETDLFLMIVQKFF